MRAAGVSLVRPAKAPQTRVRYAALGVLLAVELAGGVAVEAARRTAELVRTHLLPPPPPGTWREQRSAATADRVPAAALEPEGVVAGEGADASVRGDGGEGANARREAAAEARSSEASARSRREAKNCVLCMGPRKDPAVTECGGCTGQQRPAPTGLSLTLSHR